MTFDTRATQSAGCTPSRGLRLAALAATAALTTAACGSGALTGSDGPTLTVSGYGGSIQKAMERSVIPPFEKQCNCAVEYVPGTSADTVAKLQAQKTDPRIDVAFIDEGPQNRARKLDLIAPLDPKIVTNLDDVYKLARIPNDEGVGMSIDAYGIAYNTEWFKKQGIPAPESWTDFANPKLKGKLVVPSISTYGKGILMMLAKINGGGANNIAPGFEAMKKIAPSVVTYPTSADYSNFFLQGTAVMTVWGQARVDLLADQGFPVQFVLPKEGAPLLMSSANVVKNAPNEKLAQEFVNYLISPKAQKILANKVYFSPVNTKVNVQADMQDKLIYGDAEVSKLVQLKWPTIMANIDKWLNRWHEQIESISA